MVKGSTWMILSVFMLIGGGCLGNDASLIEEREHSLHAGAIDSLAFDVTDGSLEVVGDPATHTIDVEVRLYSSRTIFDRDEAARQSLRVGLESVDGEAQLVVEFEGGTPSGYYADVFVRLPSRLAVRGSDTSGSAMLSDLGSLVFQDGSGEIEVTSIEGALEIDDQSGGVVVSDVRGDATIIDESGQLTLERIDGALQVMDDSGEIEIETVGGDVHVTDTSGNISIFDVAGQVTVRDGSGDITVGENVSLLVEQNESGQVRRR